MSPYYYMNNTERFNKGDKVLIIKNTENDPCTESRLKAIGVIAKKVSVDEYIVKFDSMCEYCLFISHMNHNQVVVHKNDIVPFNELSKVLYE